MKLNLHLLFLCITIMVIVYFMVYVLKRHFSRINQFKPRIELVTIFERFRLKTDSTINLVKGVSDFGDTIYFHDLEIENYRKLKLDSSYLIEFVRLIPMEKWYSLKRIY